MTTSPKLLIIGGHQRSGTTLLNTLCNFHPDMRMTMEFRMFSALNTLYSEYIQNLRHDWCRRPLVMFHPKDSRWRQQLASAWFLAQYALRLLPYHFRRHPIDSEAIRQVAGVIFPGKQIVGDKYPRYHENLDEFAQLPNCYRVFIYRDCRDVAASWYVRFGLRGVNLTLGEISARWVNAIETVERNASHIHIIRYEELVTKSYPVIQGLSAYLQVDPDGFNLDGIYSSSIGKHRGTLTAVQLAEVMDVAAPTLRRLGYL